MAAVYKSLQKGKRKADDVLTSEAPKNKQRVLMLSSRGVTYR